MSFFNHRNADVHEVFRSLDQVTIHDDTDDTPTVIYPADPSPALSIVPVETDQPAASSPSLPLMLWIWLQTPARSLRKLLHMGITITDVSG